MKKKILAVVLSLGVLTFFATTLNTSISSGENAQPLTSASNTEEVVTASGSDATPTALWASIARAAVVYGTAAVKQAVKDAAYVAEAGMLVGTEVKDQDAEVTDEIFDK